MVEEAIATSQFIRGSGFHRSSFNQAHEKIVVGESYMVIDHKGHVAKCHMEIQKPVTNMLML